MFTGRRASSRLDLVAAIILVLLLIAVALHLLLRFSVKSEQLQVEEVLNSIQQSLRVLTSERMLKYDMASLSEWHRANPVKLLLVAPNNYVGEYGDRNKPKDDAVWYYNYDSKVLVYNIKHAEYVFTLDSARPAQLAFKLNFKFADKNANRQFDAGLDKAYGLELVPVTAYEWLE